MRAIGHTRSRKWAKEFSGQQHRRTKLRPDREDDAWARGRVHLVASVLENDRRRRDDEAFGPKEDEEEEGCAPGIARGDDDDGEADMRPDDARLVASVLDVGWRPDHEYFTRERIRQIEAKALRKLRHPSRSEGLKNHLGIGSPDSSGWGQ